MFTLIHAEQARINMHDIHNAIVGIRFAYTARKAQCSWGDVKKPVLPTESADENRRRLSQKNRQCCEALFDAVDNYLGTMKLGIKPIFFRLEVTCVISILDARSQPRSPEGNHGR